MGFSEESLQAGLLLRGSIQGLQEGLPLSVVQDKARLVRERLLRLLTSASDSELGDIHALRSAATLMRLSSMAVARS
jgi:hypothetical protein